MGQCGSLVLEILSCSREGGNRDDPFAVAVQKSNAMVGHVLGRISCVCSQRRFDAMPHRSLCYHGSLFVEV